MAVKVVELGHSLSNDVVAELGEGNIGSSLIFLQNLVELGFGIVNL